MPTNPMPVLTWDEVQTLPEKAVVRDKMGETLFACQARSANLGPYLLLFDEGCSPVLMEPGYMVLDGWRLRGVFADGTFVEGIYRDGLIFCGESHEFTRDQFAEVYFIPALFGGQPLADRAGVDMVTRKHIILAEDGFGSMNGEAIAVVETLDEAKEFVADPPEPWRGHVRFFPYGLAVYEATRLDEEDLR